MRILLVEDKADLSPELYRNLSREGYAVDTATDGRDGLAKALCVSYDLIILNVMLPLLSGWCVLDALREKKSTPVLMITAQDTPTDRIRGLDAGADDYLAKPFDIGELKARIRAITRRCANQAHPVLLFGHIRVDTRTRQFFRDGAPLSLTAREFAIIEYLALHRGEVISRSTLYEHIFNEHDDSLSNVIDVHIFNLRKKLGADFILTRRGHGYLIE